MLVIRMVVLLAILITQFFFPRAVLAQQQSCSGTPDVSSPYGYDPRTGLSLGRSFEPVNPAQNFRRCVDSDGEIKTDISTGRSNISVQIIDNRQSFLNAIGLSAGAHAHFPGASIDARLTDTDNRTFDENSLTFVVKAYADFGLFEMLNPRLRQDIQDLVSAGRSDLVTNRCGSVYVEQVDRQVSYSLIYTYSNLSTSEKQALSVAFSAAYSSGGSDYGAELAWTNARQSLSRRARVNVESVANGGGTAALSLQACLIGKDLQTLSNIQSCLVSFINAVAANPSAAAASNFYIASMQGWGVSPCYQVGVKRRDDILGSIEIAEIDAFFTSQNLQNLANEIGLGLSNGSLGKQQVLALAVQYSQYLNALENLRLQCLGDAANNFANCKRPLEAVPPVVAPDIPPNFVGDLYNASKWSLYRWCEGLRDGSLSPQTATGNVAAAILRGVGLSDISATTNCLSVLTVIQNGQAAIQVQPASNIAAVRTVDFTPFYALLSPAIVNNLKSLKVLPDRIWGECLNLASGLPVGSPITDPVCNNDFGASVCPAYTCAGGVHAGDPCTNDGDCSAGAPCAPTPCVIFARQAVGVDILRNFTGLHELVLNDLGLNDSDIDALFAPGAAWANLTALELRRNFIQSFNHEWPTTLRSISLNENQLGRRPTVSRADVFATLLPMTALRMLDVTTQPIGGNQPSLSAVMPSTCADPPGSTNDILNRQTTVNMLEFFGGVYDAVAAQEAAGRLDANAVQVLFVSRGVDVRIDPACLGSSCAVNGTTYWLPIVCNVLDDGLLSVTGTCPLPPTGMGCMLNPLYRDGIL